MPTVEWIDGKASEFHYQQVHSKNLSPLLTFFHVCYLFWFIDVYLLLVLISTDVNNVLFVLDLHMKYTMEAVNVYSYIVWFVIVW